jgi:diguanylate cyclase (GGDEF)-like protein
MQKLFPDSASGSLYLFKSSRNLVEAAAHWGSASMSEPSFAPHACWGLRRAQAHWNLPEGSGVRCLHLPQPLNSACLCVPMVGQEGALGMLCLEFGKSLETTGYDTAESLHDAQRELATTVAAQIAFSLTSLRLRETLRDQSIRDPLTSLFNRRFMEESLARELQRATRKNNAVSILFLDLDHFKRFNDDFGHEAGDLVLRAIADLFRRFFRADDVCCRFGGEEFAIILPESSAFYAGSRANELRQEVKSLKLSHKDKMLGGITLSVGVAAFPEHAASAEELLAIADRCLYQSKAAGRDTVTIAVSQPVV